MNHQNLMGRQRKAKTTWEIFKVCALATIPSKYDLELWGEVGRELRRSLWPVVWPPLFRLIAMFTYPISIFVVTALVIAAKKAQAKERARLAAIDEEDLW